MAAVFRFFRFRFHFRALDAVRLPAGKAANAIRGALGEALGTCAPPEVFARLFHPTGDPGITPSGLSDPPRPFVLRAARLDGMMIPRGGSFFFDVHAFEVARPPVAILREAFARLAGEGIGPGRGKAALERVDQLDLEEGALAVEDAPAGDPIAVDLEAAPNRAVETVRLEFVTPTALKNEGELVDRPEFAVVFGRLSSRLGALAGFYGDAPLAVDYKAWNERARSIRLTAAAVAWKHTERRSSRTGQVHPLSGFTGHADYTGDLTGFVPWLGAARWVGVGAHTVWGQGDVRVIPIPAILPRGEGRVRVE